MVDLGYVHSTREIKPNVGFEPLPEGWYVAMVQKSELKENRAKTGRYIQLELSVLDGQYKGRRIFINLNIENPSEKAVEIARGELSAIAQACNVVEIRDTEMLHAIPFQILVKLEKRKDNSEISNVIRGYKPYGGTTAPSSLPPVMGDGEEAAPWAT
jgi:hypothetical protein